MNTFERRMSIIDILAERRKEQVENLAFEFNVTERTIRNDLFELSLSYPIETKKGKGGCVFVPDGFTLQRRFLTEKEKAVLERLSQSVSKEDADVLQRIVKSFGKKK